MKSFISIQKEWVLICLIFLLASATLAQNQSPRVTPTSNIWYYEYLPPGYDAAKDDYPILFQPS